ncbi:hypothetical protein DGM93_17445 [Xanthomonas phaseoli pv. phaseoli]|nr:hypothetical protein DGM93_17445 [Xanthomonas phaseoli pv. phaseoli]QWN34163.1 hypothetical protein DGM81_17205 [Xanthomonas phaseoli pv. phaseoli]
MPPSSLQGRIYGVSRKRRGHRALEQLALASKRIQQERAVCSIGLKAGRPSARRQLHCLQRCRIAANKRREPLSGGRGRRSERSARARHADSKHRPCTWRLRKCVVRRF